MSINYIVLKAAIAAETNSTFVALRNGGETGQMAAWYNADSTTNAWIESTASKVLDEASDYSSFDSIVAGKRDAWALFLQYAPRDMSKSKNRKVVTDVWGSAIASSIAENILLASTEKASLGELVFGSTSATTGTVTAIKRNWVGDFSNNDIVIALAS
jgi:hypothetical protein